MSDSRNDTALPDEPAAPVQAGERFHSMDALRGVAVLGILVMNIYAFAMPFAAYQNPLIMGGTDALNLGTWFFTHVFFDQKFLAIFAMLYGAGIAMMSERAMARDRTITATFYRRSFWLLLIGIVHGWLIWFGDILFAYAVVGMLMFLFRNFSPKKLVLIALFMLPVANLATYGLGFVMQDMQTTAEALEARQQAGETLSKEELETIAEWSVTAGFMDPGEEEIAKDIAAYRGDYRGILEYRIPQVAMFQVQGTLMFLLWRAGGLMLIGMALLKLGILKAQRSAAFYRNMMLLGYGIGLPIMAYSAVDLYAHQFDGMYMFHTGLIANYWGSIFVALGHIGLVMGIVRSGLFAGIMRRFAAVGRMAFTNYLMHSIVMTTIFYGYGLNLYTEIPRFHQMFFVLAMIGCQLSLSPWWLERFRFGPAEWVWRSLSYWRRQPFRA